MSQSCRLTTQCYSVLLIWDYFLQKVLSLDYHAPWRKTVSQLWPTFLMIISDVIIRWLSPDSFHLRVLQIFQSICYICGEAQSPMVASLISRLPCTTAKHSLVPWANISDALISWSGDCHQIHFTYLYHKYMYLNICYFRGESRSPDDGRRLVSRTLHSLCYSWLPDFDMPFWNIPSHVIN